MKFRNDDQRKAMFARMGMNRFARRTSLEMAADDISFGDAGSSLFDDVKKPKPLKLPEGTQAVFLISDYGSSIQTKAAARDAVDAYTGDTQRADILPLWDGKELKGHAVVSFEQGGRGIRQYLPGATDVETVRQEKFLPTEREVEAAKQPERIVQPPISDKFKEYEASLLSSGMSPKEVAAEISRYKDFEGDESEKKYLTDLMEAFESSDAEDFAVFKKKFDSTYKGKKSYFSKKSKADYFAVIQRGDDEYACSFCGDVFSNRVTCARHAASCDGNSFNDKDTEYDEEENDDEDTSGNYDSPDGFSI
jgi:hypothetical protein